VGVILQGGPYFAAIDGLRAGLKELGLEEGKQFVLYVRDAKGDLKAVEAAAQSLEVERVDLIYSVGTSVTLAVKRATTNIPIVFYAGTDPVAGGLVASFPKPGGRFTGVHGQVTDLSAKRLELLKEMTPRMRRVLALYNPDNPAAQRSATMVREAARQLKVKLVERPIASVEELRAALRALRPGEVDAIAHVTDAMVTSQADLIIETARAMRLPTIFQDKGSAGRGARQLRRELLHDRPALGQAHPAGAVGPPTPGICP
jgi:putative ABC transport system substrate-binding protein